MRARFWILVIILLLGLVSCKTARETPPKHPKPAQIDPKTDKPSFE